MGGGGVGWVGSAGWLAGWLLWLVGWLAGWLLWLVGWLAGWLAGMLVVVFVVVVVAIVVVKGGFNCIRLLACSSSRILVLAKLMMPEISRF